MSTPHLIGVIDCQMGIGVEAEHARRARVRRGVRDRQSRLDLVKEIPSPFAELSAGASAADAVSATIVEMDRHGVERAMVAIDDDRPLALEAVALRPDRFFASYETDPHRGMDEVRKIERLVRDHGVRAVLANPAGRYPFLAVDDRRLYPILAKCAELGLPFCPELGVPSDRVPFSPQKVERIDGVAHDFPELEIVMRGGCEPWTRLAVLLMRKWPTLSFMTWGAPTSWPREITEFANGAGGNRIVYAGDAPIRLSLEQSFKELPEVGLRSSVWPQVLRENALRIFGLPEVPTTP